MITLYVIGLPLIGYLILAYNRLHLEDENFAGKFRYLYQGLKSNRFYWEFVNTFRKLLIILLNVFLSTYED
jgi:hypothetical protein